MSVPVGVEEAIYSIAPSDHGPLLLGVDSVPDNKVETCIEGYAPIIRLGSDTAISYQVVATRFTNPWIVTTFVVPA